MGIFLCPVCGELLEISGKSYVCKNRHSFDIAKSGYVNLLLSRHGAVHGDNKLMLKARRAFLDSGFYAPLCENVSAVAAEFAKNGCTILDAGCGEGYYTTAVKKLLGEREINADIYGIDISKDAVEMASKRRCGIIYSVASVFHIPVISESCDILLTIFAPYCGDEYRRVLKKGGIMIMAIPSRNHLWELKKAIYNTPYKNEVKPYELSGFEFLESRRIRFNMTLNGKEEIVSLFSMTPYYYKTGKIEQERLNELEYLETEADFEILIYLRK